MSTSEAAGPRCFCRDCLADLDMGVRRCSACGSPRLVRHRSLASLTIAHIDCDAFYATVEKRDNPDIADKPVIIGGGKRGVVSAACYIARTYGVRSAMPMFRALEACPHATVIPPDMAKYVRVGFIFGVGPATQERLVQRGFRVIADLQKADEIEMMRQFPSDGRRLWRLARGIDDRRVEPDRSAKTISSETTFETDIRDFATLEKILWRLCEKTSSRLKSSALAGCTVTLKLKTADFRQRTRSQSIAAPTQLAAKIFSICREMLAKEIDGTAFRLMGAGVSALRDGSPADDTDMLDRRAAHAERAVDSLRKKFGSAAVIRGIAYEGPEKAQEQ